MVNLIKKTKGLQLKNPIQTGLVIISFLVSSAAFAAQFNSGDRVMHATYGLGTVSDTSDGTAEVNFDQYGNQTVDLDSLSETVKCIHDVCKDSEVDNEVYGSGTVIEVFSDNTANVQFDNYGAEVVSIRSLSVTAQPGDEEESVQRGEEADRTGTSSASE